ncbi:MAG: DsbA family oxidoreductase [Microthrixaceae bacterium]
MARSPIQEIEVYADVACPFAHAGLRRFVEQRDVLGTSLPRLRVRAWPLELVNDTPHSGAHLAPEIEALRAKVAPGLFAGFDAPTFPTTTMTTLAAAAAAYRAGIDGGEAFSLAVRDALWEQGLDVSDRVVLRGLATDLGVPEATADDDASVRADLEQGRARGVDGSPHFFTPTGDFFCPSLDISTDSGEMKVSFDQDGFTRFVNAIFD